MTVAVVQGNYFDIDGAAMPGSSVPDILFRLNGPNAAAVGNGALYPTKNSAVKPSSSGEFSLSLAVTAEMHFDAWYEIGLRWNQDGNTGGRAGTLWDPGLRIRIPSGGTHKITDLIDRTAGPGSGGGGSGGGGGNPMIWWFGLTPPPSRATIWNYLDPDDPDRKTGPIPELTIGDIITRW